MEDKKWYERLNWGDIVSKLFVAAIPLLFGSVMLNRETGQRTDLQQRHDSLLVEFNRYKTFDAPRDTAQGKNIRSLLRLKKRGVRFAAVDTLEVVRDRPSWWRRWWSAVKRGPARSK